MRTRTDNHAFCRAYYKETMKDVRKVVSKELVKESWVWQNTSAAHSSYEFQIPSQNVYWYGQAHCAWDAKAKGWSYYLQYHLKAVTY